MATSHDYSTNGTGCDIKCLRTALPLVSTQDSCAAPDHFWAQHEPPATHSLRLPSSGLTPVASAPAAEDPAPAGCAAAA